MNEQELFAALLYTPSPHERLIRLYEKMQPTSSPHEIQGIMTVPYHRDQADQIFGRLLNLVEPQHPPTDPSSGPELQTKEVSIQSQVAQGGSTPLGDGPACAIEVSKPSSIPEPKEENRGVPPKE